MPIEIAYQNEEYILDVQSQYQKNGSNQQNQARDEIIWPSTGESHASPLINALIVHSPACS